MSQELMGLQQTQLTESQVATDGMSRVLVQTANSTAPSSAAGGRTWRGHFWRRAGHFLQAKLGVNSVARYRFLADFGRRHARPAISVIADEVGVGTGDLAVVDGNGLDSSRTANAC